MKKTVSVLALCGLLYFSQTRGALARYYSGSDEGVKQLLLDKEVRALTQGRWYDNLNSSQILFSAKSMVDFQITIRNTGNLVLENIEIKDTLPLYMEYVYGPGEYDASTRVAKWKINKINPGEDKVFHLRARVQEAGLPLGISQLCNSAEGKSGDGCGDKDKACYYINAPAGTKKIPDTGGSGVAIGTLVLFSMGIFGFGLRKVGRGEI